jgi:2-polyprenyl-6-methoxyphenol hydroxylase-like FAD-dependent oxidoreductase
MEGGIRSWKGKLLIGSSAAKIEERFGAPNIVVHRAELQASLLDALGAQYVEFGKQCVGVEQDREGVRARFADGCQAHGDLLIGADGLHSLIRSQLHGPQPPTYAGYTAWRGIVVFDHQRLQPGESWGAGMRFGQIPLSHGRVYWFATKNAPEGKASAKGEKRELLRLFSDWHAPIKALIEASDPSAILRHDIYDRPVLKKWGEGRITLLGDAAHPMTPNLGQGACQALEDTLVLANALQKEPHIPSALRAYEAQRIPRTNSLVKQSRQVGQIGQWEEPLAVRLRDLLAQHILSRFQMRQLEPILGYEP